MTTQCNSIGPQQEPNRGQAPQGTGVYSIRNRFGTFLEPEKNNEPESFRSRAETGHSGTETDRNRTRDENWNRGGAEPARRE